MDFKVSTIDTLTNYKYFSFFDKITEANIEQYYKYLCDLILEVDYNKAIINFDIGSDANILKKEYYDQIYDAHYGPACSFNTHYVYNIDDKKSKEVLIKHITFCLNDYDTGDIIPVTINKKYISNNESLKNNTITLLKDNTIVVVIYYFGGFVNDYRPWEKIRNQKSELSGLRYNPKIAEFGLYRSHGEEYRYSALFDELKVDYPNIDKDWELLRENCYGRDNGKLEKYLDLFREYIFDLIDECDYFVLEEFALRERDYYAQFLKYEVFDDVVYSGPHKYLMYSSRVYDISRKEDKETFKNHLLFNVNSPDNEYIELHVKREYFHNDEKDYNDGNRIHFIKEGKELFELETNTGDIIDYRDPEVIKAHQKKYSKIAKEKHI